MAGTHLLHLTQEEMTLVGQCLANNPGVLLQIPHVRVTLAKHRLQRLAPSEVRIYEHASSAVRPETVPHNHAQLMRGAALTRPERLLCVLLALDDVLRRSKEMRVLSVGPRSEAELLYLASLGFLPEHITGLDLISASPSIDVGDMHQMPYPDGSFDVVVLGWVLAYSSDNAQVAREAMRVAKPGAIMAVGCEYCPPAKRGSIAGARTFFTSTEEILTLFAGHVRNIYFRHDIHPTATDRTGAIMVVFELAKEPIHVTTQHPA